MDRKTLMQRRMTRGLVLLGSAVAVVATPLWMAAQQSTGGPTTGGAVGTSAPAGKSGPVTLPMAPPAPGGPIIAATVPTTGPVVKGKGAPTPFLMRFHDAPLDTVLEYLSKEAGYTVIKSAPVDGRVTIWQEQPITIDQILDFLNSALKDRGYAAVVDGNKLKVGTIADIEHGSIPVHISANPDEVPVTDSLVTWVIPVRSVDAVKLKADLQPLVSATANLAANGGSNSIILTDTSANVRRIVQIVASLDKKDELANDIIVQHLIYADATATAKLITDIFKPADNTNSQQNGQRNGGNNPFGFIGGRGGGGGGGGQGGGGGGFGGGGLGGGQGGAAAAAAGSEEGRTGTVVASADTRTNTVVVTGPKDTLDLIKEKILGIIDKNPVTDQVIFTYKVKNGQAIDMQTTLNTLFGANISTGGSSNRTNYSSQTGNRSSTGFGSGVGGSSGGGIGGSSLGSSGSGNRNGTSGNNNSSQNRGGQTGGGGGIASTGAGGASSPTADLVGQVEVVADTDTNSLLVVTATRYKEQVQDIIKELDRPVPQVLIKVLIAEVTHDRSDDIGVDFSSLNLSKGLGVGLNQGNSAAAAALVAAGGGSGLTVNLVESQITSTFHALAVAGKLDVLSRPYILTSDNQEATILVGQEVPFVTNTRVDTLGGTTSSINYQDIGILLDVTPHVNPEGLVIMDVAPQISSQSEQSIQLQAGVSSPVFNQRSATSHVAVRDGDTIVIGGLMQDQKSMTVTKVPVLGDIPYLGLLFQRDQVSKTKTELLIFLTPHVALQPEHLVPMSADEVRSLHLTPGAVQPGTFQEHIQGLRRGGSATQPALETPKPEYDRDAWEPEPRMP